MVYCNTPTKCRTWGVSERNPSHAPPQKTSLLPAPIMASRAIFMLVAVACVVLSAKAMLPLPREFTYGQGVASLSGSMVFHSSSQSAILQAALSRIHSQIFIFKAPFSASTYHMNVTVKSDSEKLEYGVGAFDSYSGPFYQPQ